MKIAALGDLHIRKGSKGRLKSIFLQISKEAEVLVLCGDLTNGGYIEEAKILIDELGDCRIPVIGVLGNHDFDKNKEEEIKAILNTRNITILDGDSYIYNEIGFAGVKGFCGGFGKYMLFPLGEQIIKKFVDEAENETLKLEHAMSSLNTRKKVVILHYSPIKETIIGEPPEIQTFLGSDRLLRPIENLGTSIVFHGHSHHGTVHGKTMQGIPVYNVAFSLLESKNKPYLLIDL